MGVDVCLASYYTLYENLYKAVSLKKDKKLSVLPLRLPDDAFKTLDSVVKTFQSINTLLQRNAMMKEKDSASMMSMINGKDIENLVGFLSYCFSKSCTLVGMETLYKNLEFLKAVFSFIKRLAEMDNICISLSSECQIIAIWSHIKLLMIDDDKSKVSDDFNSYDHEVKSLLCFIGVKMILFLPTQLLYKHINQFIKESGFDDEIVCYYLKAFLTYLSPNEIQRLEFECYDESLSLSLSKFFIGECLPERENLLIYSTKCIFNFIEKSQLSNNIKPQIPPLLFYECVLALLHTYSTIPKSALLNFINHTSFYDYIVHFIFIELEKSELDTLCFHKLKEAFKTCLLSPGFSVDLVTEKILSINNDHVKLKLIILNVLFENEAIRSVVNSKYHQILNIALKGFSSKHLQHVSLTLFFHLLQCAPEGTQDVKVIYRLLKNWNQRRERVLCDLFLKRLFCHNEQFYLDLVHFLIDNSEDQSSRETQEILLVVLKSGKSLDLWPGEKYHPILYHHMDWILFGPTPESQKMDAFCTSEVFTKDNFDDEDILLIALGIFTEYKKLHTPSEKEYSIVTKFIQLYAKSQSSSFRQRFIVSLNQFFNRVLKGLSQKNHPEDINNANKFMSFLVHFIYSEGIHIDASYQFLSISCQLLLSIYSIFKAMINTKGTEDEGPFNELSKLLWIKLPLLIPLFWSPFEDIRKMVYQVVGCYCFPLNDVKESKKEILLNEIIHAGFGYLKSPISEACVETFKIFYLKQSHQQEKFSNHDEISTLLDKLSNKIYTLCERIKTDSLSSVANIYESISGYLEAYFMLLKVSDNEGKICFRASHGLILRSMMIFGEVTRPLLCHASPEGLKLEGEVDEEEDSSVFTISSYCWLAIKQFSILLSYILTRASSEGHLSLTGLTVDDIVYYSTFMKELLLSLRHLGAFSSLQIPFHTLCRYLLREKEPRLSLLPFEWLKAFFDEDIQIQNVTCTRRSAGIPFCILAIINNEPDNYILPSDHAKDVFIHHGSSLNEAKMISIGRRRLLSYVLNKLFSLCSVQNLDSNACSEAKIHALNILRAMFKETSLSSDLFVAIPECFEICCGSFYHPNWSIRNSAIMLFAALMTRVFGPPKSRKGKRHTGSLEQAEESDGCINDLDINLFFNRHKLLVPVILKYFKTFTICRITDHIDMTRSCLFPLLICLTNLSPTSSIYYQYIPIVDELRTIIMNVGLGHQIYHVRVVAVNAFISLLAKNERSLFIDKIFKWIQETLNRDKIKMNHLHGLCLCLLKLLKKLPINEALNLRGVLNALATRLLDTRHYHSLAPSVVSVILKIVKKVNFTFPIAYIYSSQKYVIDLKSNLIPVSFTISLFEHLNHINLEKDIIVKQIVEIQLYYSFITSKSGGSFLDLLEKLLTSNFNEALHFIKNKLRFAFFALKDYLDDHHRLIFGQLLNGLCLKLKSSPSMMLINTIDDLYLFCKTIQINPSCGIENIHAMIKSKDFPFYHMIAALKLIPHSLESFDENKIHGLLDSLQFFYYQYQDQLEISPYGRRVYIYVKVKMLYKLRKNLIFYTHLLSLIPFLSDEEEEVRRVTSYCLTNILNCEKVVDVRQAHEIILESSLSARVQIADMITLYLTQVEGIVEQALFSTNTFKLSNPENTNSAKQFWIKSNLYYDNEPKNTYDDPLRTIYSLYCVIDKALMSSARFDEIHQTIQNSIKKYDEILLGIAEFLKKRQFKGLETTNGSERMNMIDEDRLVIFQRFHFSKENELDFDKIYIFLLSYSWLIKLLYSPNKPHSTFKIEDNIKLSPIKKLFSVLLERISIAAFY